MYDYLAVARGFVDNSFKRCGAFFDARAILTAYYAVIYLVTHSSFVIFSSSSHFLLRRFTITGHRRTFLIFLFFFLGCSACLLPFRLFCGLNVLLRIGCLRQWFPILRLAFVFSTGARIPPTVGSSVSSSTFTPTFFSVPIIASSVISRTVGAISSVPPIVGSSVFWTSLVRPSVVRAPSESSGIGSTLRKRTKSL